MQPVAGVASIEDGGMVFLGQWIPFLDTSHQRLLVGVHTHLNIQGYDF